MKIITGPQLLAMGSMMYGLNITEHLQSNGMVIRRLVCHCRDGILNFPGIMTMP